MNKISVILMFAVIGLATVCAIQTNRLRALRVQHERLAADLQRRTESVAELQQAQEQIDRQKRQLQQLTEDLTSQIKAQSRHAAATNSPATSNPSAVVASTSNSNGLAGGFGGMLSKLMSDPDTKKFIREQQRMMMDQMYAPLIKQLGLSPEEGAAFKDLLADNMVKGAEKATSLFGASTNRAELAATMAAEQKDADEQIRGFLGEERYSAYKNYQETVGERMQLNMFRQQNDSRENPVNDIQFEQLLGFMKDEKRNIATALAPGASQEEAGLNAMLSEEQGEKFISSQEAANQRIFERARSILSPDQLRSFGQFQANQLQMMRVGMTMARRMMAPESGGASAPAAGPGM